MTAGTALGLYRKMFINERPLFIDMAFEASGISVCRLACLPQTRRTVHVVAVIALNQTFVNAVMKRPRELSPRLMVASITKLGLLLGQQRFLLATAVHGMAIDASHIAAGVHRGCRVAMAGFLAMARQAALVAFSARLGGEAEDLALITSAGNVVGAGPMARFATPAFLCRLKMRSRLKLFLINILVTARAGICTNILSTGTCRLRRVR